MILYVQGDLFQSPAQVLVNTVNTVGVMGKGVALEFKRLYPEMYRQYRDVCENGQFKIGTLWLYKSPNKWVLNFPTKKHWRHPSRIEYIESGLEKFISTYAEMGIHSIAFPPLGCGNGQLDFKSQVQPLMQKYLRNMPIDIFIYPDRKDEFIEHLSPKAMKKWLRSEPRNLPFSEVWEDLVQLLNSRNTFETPTRKSSFTASVSDDSSVLEIIASGHRYYIEYEILMSFWQQIRTHGFTMRHIAPGIDREISYLIPIFAELDYVKPVYLSDDFSNRKRTRAIGLQVLPSAFIQRVDPEPVQLPLLELI